VFEETHGEVINYYEVLEVHPEATADEIKRSFRRLAKKYHPDHNSERTRWAEAKMRVLLKAYDILMNDQQRQEYDKRLRPYLKSSRDPYRENLAKRIEKAMRCACSSTSPPLIRMPNSAPRPVPTIMAVGVANPIAHGHAIINTATVLISAVSMPDPCTHHSPHVNNAIAKITGTKIFVILSASF